MDKVIDDQGIIEIKKNTSTEANFHFEPGRRPSFSFIANNQISTEFYKIINGSFSGIGRTTFINCKLTNRNFSHNGFRYTFNCDYALLGCSLGEDQLSFNNILIESLDLGLWIDKPIYKSESKDKQIVIIVDPPYEVAQFDIDNDLIGIFHIGYSSSIYRREGASVRLLSSLEIKSKKSALPLTVLLQSIYKFERFFTLISGKRLRIRRLTLNNKVELLMKEPTKENNRGSDLVFSYDDIQFDLGKLSKRWFTEEKLNPVIDSLFSNYRIINLDVETMFLNACFAFETFHRRYINNQALTEEEFNRRVKYLEDNLSEKKIKSWVFSKMQYGYEPNFRDRLKDIKELIALVYHGKPKEFIHHIVESRNYYVHYGGRKESVLLDENLKHLTVQIQCLAKAVIFINLGLNQVIVKRQLERVKE